MKAALIVFDRMTYLDFVGFYDPVTRLRSMNFLPDFEWRILSNQRQIGDDRGSAGMKMSADGILEPLGGYDLLYVPGGMGTRTLQHDAAFVEWLKTAAPVKLKVSVCTGALLLGAAGFLKGKRATTHPGALKELEQYCAKVLTGRIIDEGSVVTGSGVAASLDLGLHVVERLAGPDARARIAAQMCYPYRYESVMGDG